MRLAQQEGVPLLLGLDQAETSYQQRTNWIVYIQEGGGHDSREMVTSKLTNTRAEYAGQYFMHCRLKTNIKSSSYIYFAYSVKGP